MLLVCVVRWWTKLPTPNPSHGPFDSSPATAEVAANPRRARGTASRRIGPPTCVPCGRRLALPRDAQAASIQAPRPRAAPRRLDALGPDVVRSRDERGADRG